MKEGSPAAFNFGAELRKIFEFARFDVMAAAMQIFIEEMAIRWIKNCIAQTKIKKLALAGGLFMNVKLNKKILELPEVESVYIMPSSGDESTPIGAAYYKAVELGVPLDKIEPLKALYLGPDYSNQDINHALGSFKFRNKVKITKMQSVEETVSDLLFQGNIVALYQGREEFGARALGNRSILADPSDVNVIKVINKMIKSRDFWMPFAGTMTEVQAQINLKNPKKHFAPYMVMAFDIQANINDFRAAIHPYDETMRPQVLIREWNPVYYRILELFEKKSHKRGGLLNTSFNLHGYPIVSSPRDALEALDKSGLKFLALGPYLISKE
jgi:carbamoyltransferase